MLEINKYLFQRFNNTKQYKIYIVQYYNWLHLNLNLLLYYPLICNMLYIIYIYMPYIFILDSWYLLLIGLWFIGIIITVRITIYQVYFYLKKLVSKSKHF